MIAKGPEIAELGARRPGRFLECLTQIETLDPLALLASL